MSLIIRDADGRKRTIIGSKIVAQRIVKPEAENAPADTLHIPLETIHEGLERPDVLFGATYKIKPSDGSAVYVTINNYKCNEGTEHESIHPYEIFINSRTMNHFQWSTSLTRTISAVFRKGGTVEFIPGELKETFDPAGGYYDKYGTYHKSIVAHIGQIIEEHLYAIGYLKKPEIEEHFQALIEEKSQLVDTSKKGSLCGKCNEYSVFIVDGCATCMSCGDSKCG